MLVFNGTNNWFSLFVQWWCFVESVVESEKSIEAEKFQIIHQAYSILSDVDQRKKYNAGDVVLFSKQTRASQWGHFLKPMPNNEMDNARIEYQNSIEEETEIEREYKAGNGSMLNMMNNIPFMRIEEQSRVIAIITKLVSMNRVPQLKLKKIRE